MKTSQPPSTPEDRQYLKGKVAEILAERGKNFDRFQAMKKQANRAVELTMNFSK